MKFSWLKSKTISGGSDFSELTATLATNFDKVLPLKSRGIVITTGIE
jgi:hypothetical protein